MNPDFRDLLRLFEKHEVEYLIVGGYAVIRYTQPRFTKDLDLWVRPNKTNAAKVATALREFGVPLIEVTEEDFAATGLQFVIGMPPSAIDFLTTVEGLDFEPAWLAKRIFETPACRLYYLSPGDLVAAKKACGRLKDLADIEEILRILPEVESRNEP